MSDGADVPVTDVLDENCDAFVEPAALEPPPRPSLDVMLRKAGPVDAADGAALAKGSPAVSSPYWLAIESSALETLENIEENSV